jgi:hypothetical protein
MFLHVLCDLNYNPLPYTAHPTVWLWFVGLNIKQLFFIQWFPCTHCLFCCVCLILPWLCIYLFFSAPCHLVVLGSLGFWLLLVGCLRCVTHTHTLHDATGWQSLALNLWWKWRLGWTASTHPRTCTQQAPSLSLWHAVKLIPGPRNTQVYPLFRRTIAEVSSLWIWNLHLGHCIRFSCAWSDLLVAGKVALSVCIKKILWSYS